MTTVNSTKLIPINAADERIESYFATNPIKTKTIFYKETNMAAIPGWKNPVNDEIHADYEALAIPANAIRGMITEKGFLQDTEIPKEITGRSANVVKGIQAGLHEIGISPGNIDGFFGEKTKRALGQFKQAVVPETMSGKTGLEIALAAIPKLFPQTNQVSAIVQATAGLLSLFNNKK